MKKLNKNKGFTLAELLLVVAIIGVLVAVAIPVFHGQLENARKARDIANIRNAISAAYVDYLDQGKAEKGYYLFVSADGKAYDFTDVKDKIKDERQVLVYKKTEKIRACFVFIDTDDQAAPIKTYPYVDENREIIFRKTTVGILNGVQYYSMSPEEAEIAARKNHFDKEQ